MSTQINFGAIHGRRVVTFKVSNDGMVLSAKLRRRVEQNEFLVLSGTDPDITSREAFRRWKIARKAWRTRKHGKQLSLPL